MKFEIVINFEMDDEVTKERLKHFNTSLEDVLKDLERRYAVELEEEGKEIKEVKVVAKVIE